MTNKGLLVREHLNAGLTLVRLCTCVTSGVNLKTIRLGKRSVTVVAFVRLFAGMKSRVRLQVAQLAKAFSASFTDIWLFASVHSFMHI